MRRALRTALRWALVLGGIGFCVGYFGPLVFSPDANQGPLLGIFYTGPTSAAAGFIAGLLVAVTRVSPQWQARGLAIAALITFVVSLDAALPQPEVLAMIVDGRVVACEPVARTALEEATHRWREPPPHGWAAALDAIVDRGAGVIVRLDVERRREILRHRRPWNRAVTASGWQDASFAESYQTGMGDCGAVTRMLDGPHQVHWEVQAWPPASAAQLLHVRTLEPISATYRALL